MTADPTMRIVWHNGRPYAVSSNPQGHAPGRHWYVFYGKEWRRLFACTKEDAHRGGWRKVHIRLIEWLDQQEESR